MSGLKNLLDELPAEWALEHVPDYRRKQIAEWIFHRYADSFEAMANLPQSLRVQLKSRYELNPLKLHTCQGKPGSTQKFLWQLAHGDYIESVLLPASSALYGEKSDRLTLCVSTQVGCAYGCRFCASGLDGWKRHLTPAEIVGQILAAENQIQKRINNLVFMGMGEPLANFEHLMRAIDIINAPWGLHLGARHMTISTCGLAPEIRRLAQQQRQVRLAVSLHGTTDPVRDMLMPVNRKYPLAQLLDACAEFSAKQGHRITLEYILVADVNDSDEQAQALAQYARKLSAKVNVIPYNPVEGLPWARPSQARIRQFMSLLQRANIAALLRQEKGGEIDAACGQLRLKQIQSHPAGSAS